MGVRIITPIKLEIDLCKLENIDIVLKKIIEIKEKHSDIIVIIRVHDS